ETQLGAARRPHGDVQCLSPLDITDRECPITASANATASSDENDVSTRNDRRNVRRNGSIIEVSSGVPVSLIGSSIIGPLLAATSSTRSPVLRATTSDKSGGRSAPLGAAAQTIAHPCAAGDCCTAEFQFPL